MSPTVAQRAPFPVTVHAGQDYFWCRCGSSKSQPFCDGSHKGGPFAPMKYTAPESATIYFCGCKQSRHPPFCDGSHATL